MTTTTDIERTGDCDTCIACGNCERGRQASGNSPQVPVKRRRRFNWWSPWSIASVALPTVFLGWLFMRPLLAPPLTPQELRGKQIYFEGTSPGGGKIKAYIGKDRIPLPGSAATCGSCHGPDGQGRPEAGVVLRPQPPAGPKPPGLHRGLPEKKRPQRRRSGGQPAGPLHADLCHVGGGHQ
jgi:hypothetical protein